MTTRVQIVGRGLGDVGRDDRFTREHRTGTCRRPGHASREVHGQRAESDLRQHLLHRSRAGDVLRLQPRSLPIHSQRQNRYRPGQAVELRTELGETRRLGDGRGRARAREPGTPQFHCDLAVDGAVVVSKDGPKGVLCSLRNW